MREISLKAVRMIQGATASQKALALAGNAPVSPEQPPVQRKKSHRRGVSWGQDLRTEDPAQLAGAAERNVKYVPTQTPLPVVASPFASPFAAASVAFVDQGTAHQRMNLSHPFAFFPLPNSQKYQDLTCCKMYRCTYSCCMMQIPQ